ncbi:MAG: VWA domain-containing protein [Bacillota bacterium]|nr:VWA domain-containing protein [Bacillota bacterium]
MTLESSIVRFVYLLRALGVRVSLAETIDCFKGLVEIDILEKNQFKAVLGSTLVKNKEDYKTFLLTFNTYFANKAERSQVQSEYCDSLDSLSEDICQAEEELQFKEMPLDLSDQEKYLYSQLPIQQQEKIQQFLDRSTKGKNVEENFKPVIENVIKGSLEYWKRYLTEELDGYKELDVDLGDQELNSLYYQVKKDLAKEEVNIVNEDMKNISNDEIGRVQVLIEKMSQKLAARVSRRYRQSNKIKRIDIRRSIRANMKYGGTLLELKHTTKRVQRPKLILVCDVSGSMAKYATFVLQFIYGLASVVKNIESFVFAEKLERVTRYFKKNEDFTETMLQIINNSKVWGEGTNLGESLKQLVENEKIIKTNTIVIIMSDAKTMALKDAIKYLQQVDKAAKDVIWLNTLPKAQWEETRTIPMLTKYSRMFQCNTLAHLDAVITKELLA